MSHVDVGCGSTDRTSLTLLLLSLRRGGESMAAHQAEGVMNSEGRQCRFNRSQLLQVGFFSSQRACRDLQVKLTE
jgi:hypothetical protein